MIYKKIFRTTDTVDGCLHNKMHRLSHNSRRIFHFVMSISNITTFMII